MGAKTFVIHLGDVQAEVYLMSGFFHSSTAKESPLHSHQYPEVHFVEEGACRFLIGDDTFDCQAGDVVILPAHQLHRTYLLDNHTRHNAFLLNYPVKRVSRSAVEPRLLRNLGSLIREYREGNDFGAIAPFVTFLCEKGIKRRLQLKPVENRSFLISEFFENRYHQDVGLADLSEELGLSIKQTARLVQKHMGDSFSRVLADYRIRAAKQLLSQEPAPTLQQVSQQVGYCTYSGFWKAFKAAKGAGTQKEAQPSGKE
jgi:AraC-like DNA-binding protein/quercetin dioxygenase-like cupin family protein